jgi:signal transduction histidine kinase
MFKSAYTKLTIWYLAIVMFISIVFSVILYSIASNQLMEEIKRESYRIYKHFPIINSEPVLHPHNDLLYGDHIIILRLIIFNLVVFIAAGIASYFLARITLKPIEVNHEQQKVFTSNVSHELRTPLTALKMESEIALMNPKKDTKSLVETIKSNLEEINKLESLINNILKLSKLETEEIQNDFKTLTTKEVITKTIDKLKVIANNRDINISFKASHPNLTIQGDEESIIQLITIILDNAIKYSYQSSTINIKDYLENHHVVIEIKDSGQGMSEETLRHIFDKFYRADNSRNKAIEGYGIGLSIAKMIADIHQINIVVSSQLQKGTTVRLIFPKQDKNNSSNLKTNESKN